MERWLRAGRVGGPHGLDGSFHVVEAIPRLLAPGTVVLLGGVMRRLERRAGHERRLIVRLEGVVGREQAQALRGQRLLVDREHAPALEEQEWWAQDLEGCAVHSGKRVLGTVKRLLALPSCEVLEVSRAGEGPPLLVPLVGDAVSRVDVRARLIEVDAGFLGEV
jgi:16S rRNA processing protein RimM